MGCRSWISFRLALLDPAGGAILLCVEPAAQPIVLDAQLKRFLPRQLRLAGRFFVCQSL
jgi:hypothetical protein